MAMEACLDLNDGNFNRNIPGMLVGLLFQSLDSLRKLGSKLLIYSLIDY